MTLDELLQKVPGEFRPVVARYGPSLLAMTADELWAWVELLLSGQHDQAYRALLSRMDGEDILAEWDRLNATWAEANTENAAKKDLQRAASAAILKVLLTALLALVGL